MISKIMNLLRYARFGNSCKILEVRFLPVSTLPVMLSVDENSRHLHLPPDLPETQMSGVPPLEEGL
jgi:hypothetical protein